MNQETKSLTDQTTYTPPQVEEYTIENEGIIASSFNGPSEIPFNW